ncbi:MAG: sigma-54-dependent Fis family transcriptional regulator, partial [Victivallales bacterium]|nr:sigma-54-dependent Fis family transcriptional regulator [Victivallales bacterium]
QLELTVKRAVDSRMLREENRQLKQRLSQKYGLESIIGNSGPMHEVIETVKQVAQAKTTVLITGESGTGKELVAQSIHQQSGREGPFVPVHCAALPPTLLESELFGHEKGAFTGAAERKKGRFELADGGTLFLDEIGDIDHSTQVKLLRVLETRQFERIGGTEAINTSARILAATNRDLREMVGQGSFREDLFFRLYVIAIRMPSLRERPEDIPAMAQHFIKEFSADSGKNVSGIAEDAMNMLCSYAWPGNVRELRNCLERMVVLSNSRILQVSSIPSFIREKVSPGDLSGIMAQPATFNIEENEKFLITRALKASGKNKSQAAKLLGISRRTLHRKIKEYALDVDHGDDDDQA